MVSAFAITRFASGLISGTLVDKFGERAVFSTGIFMVSAFTFLAGIAQSYEQLLFFRAAGGLGSSMFSVAASSVILRSVSDSQRGQAQSVYQGSFIYWRNSRPGYWRRFIPYLFTCTILCLLNLVVVFRIGGANFS
jgi:MFS family permease